MHRLLRAGSFGEPFAPIQPVEDTLVRLLVEDAGFASELSTPVAVDDAVHSLLSCLAWGEHARVALALHADDVPARRAPVPQPVGVPRRQALRDASRSV